MQNAVWVIRSLLSLGSEVEPLSPKVGRVAACSPGDRFHVALHPYGCPSLGGQGPAAVCTEPGRAPQTFAAAEAQAACGL